MERASSAGVQSTTGTRLSCGCMPEECDDGSACRPVRALVCTFNESSESILLPSFMHLRIYVVVQFACGPAQVKQALIANEQVCRLALYAALHAVLAAQRARLRSVAHGIHA
jgi:hypothetical protein